MVTTTSGTSRYSSGEGAGDRGGRPRWGVGVCVNGTNVGSSSRGLSLPRARRRGRFGTAVGDDSNGGGNGGAPSTWGGGSGGWHGSSGSRSGGGGTSGLAAAGVAHSTGPSGSGRTLGGRRVRSTPATRGRTLVRRVPQRAAARRGPPLVRLGLVWRARGRRGLARWGGARPALRRGGSQHRGGRLPGRACVQAHFRHRWRTAGGGHGAPRRCAPRRYGVESTMGGTWWLGGGGKSTSVDQGPPTRGQWRTGRGGRDRWATRPVARAGQAVAPSWRTPAEAPGARRRARCFGVWSGPMAWHASLSFWRVSAASVFCDFQVSFRKLLNYCWRIGPLQLSWWFHLRVNLKHTHGPDRRPGLGRWRRGPPPPIHCLTAPASHGRESRAPPPPQPCRFCTPPPSV